MDWQNFTFLELKTVNLWQNAKQFLVTFWEQRSELKVCVITDLLQLYKFIVIRSLLNCFNVTLWRLIITDGDLMTCGSCKASVGSKYNDSTQVLRFSMLLRMLSFLWIHNYARLTEINNQPEISSHRISWNVTTSTANEAHDKTDASVMVSVWSVQEQ